MYTWEGLLSVVVTDISTIWAELIVRVRWLTTTNLLTLITTSAQVVKMSITITDNSPSQDYTHPDDQTTLFHLVYFLFFIQNEPSLTCVLSRKKISLHPWMVTGQATWRSSRLRLCRPQLELCRLIFFVMSPS